MAPPSIFRRAGRFSLSAGITLENTPWCRKLSVSLNGFPAMHISLTGTLRNQFATASSPPGRAQNLSQPGERLETPYEHQNEISVQNWKVSALLRYLSRSLIPILSCSLLSLFLTVTVAEFSDVSSTVS